MNPPLFTVSLLIYSYLSQISPKFSKMPSQTSNTLNNTIAAILASGVAVTLTPGATVTGLALGASAPLESTLTPTIPSTLTVSTTSVAQSNTNTRFSYLSSVTRTISATRSARLNRHTSIQANESEGPTDNRPTIIPISVTFYLQEIRKDIKRLQGKQ